MAPHLKGPVAYRVFIWAMSGVFALLVFWLLGFIMRDVGTWPGPDYQALEERLLPQTLVEQSATVDDQIETINREINTLRNRQKLLRDSIENSQRTVDQLLELQRLSLESDADLSPEERTAMADNIEMFLANQRQYQAYNDQLTQQNQALEDVQTRRRELDAQLSEAREPIRAQYQDQLERHNLRMAGLKLAILVPLLLIVIPLVIKSRGGTYAPIVFAAAVAVAGRVLLVMHEHFPARYFKYILILAALAAVTWVLVSLLRLVARPGKQWLLKQYRDAYEAFLCPVCSFPIRRGPLKYMAWSRRSLRKQTSQRMATAPAKEEAYTCPSCGTSLHTPCPACGEICHSLLPVCEHCGVTLQDAPAAVSE